MTLDFLEFLLTSLPECFVDRIDGLLRWILKLKASNRGGEVILNKASDLLALGQETLSADVMLPNLVAVISSDMSVTARPSSAANSSSYDL